MKTKIAIIATAIAFAGFASAANFNYDINSHVKTHINFPKLKQQQTEVVTTSVDQAIIEFDINFANNSATLTKQDKKMLDALGSQLQSNQNINVKLTGYASKTGSAEYNKKLSMKRAEAVSNYLQTEYKVNSNRLAISADGYNKPIATNKTMEGQSLNRRVDVMAGETVAVTEVSQVNG